MTRREFAEILQAFIDRHDRIILSGHVRPDGDSIGACVAMGLALQRQGKYPMIYYEGDTARYGWIEQSLPVQDSEPKIDQYSIRCIGREKIEIILRLMKQFEVSRAIVFCNTKYTTGMVAEQLHAQGLNTACLHGDMRQSERNKIMEQYKAGEIDILVATDVAARGIDVSDIQVVFNYDIPQENDAYLHRIGRTGRAKKEGISFVLHSKDEQKRLDNIIHYTRSHIIALEMDGWGVFAPKK